MALTPVTFTNNLSPAIPFSGIVKIKCDNMFPGSHVDILEERNDGNFEGSGRSWSLISDSETSRTFELYGDYKISRSHDSIAVGYVLG